MDYELSCTDTLQTVTAVLRHERSDEVSTVEQLEAAFWHLRSCLACRNALTPAERGRFVCEVALVRD